MKSLEVVVIPVGDIKPAPYNPRRDLRPEDNAYKSIVESLDQFGLVVPLVWNRRTTHLVAGHQRLTVMAAQGRTEVPVVVVDLPLAREKALNLALNRIDGEWDRDKLAGLLSELTESPGFDPVVTGFKSSEIDELLASVAGEPEADEATPATEPEAPPVTEPGELIKIGDHRILCGDATSPEALDRLMGDEVAGMVFADPPYNVDYRGDNRPTAAPSPAWQGLVNDSLSLDDYRAFSKAWLTNTRPRLEKGSGLYLWNGFANFGLMADLLVEAGLRPRHIITWAKESFSPGHGDFNEQTEFCLYARVPGGKRRWFGPKNESTLWQVTRDRTDAYVHPTQKALPLAERAIRNSSQRGEIVLDPFLGSGTTLVAAARMGRRCFATEVEPRYCDAAVRRLIAAAGRTGVPRSIIKRWGASRG